MLLNEAFDLRAPESCNLSQTDARQEWLLSSCVVVDPSLADPQPFCDLVCGQQPIRVSGVLSGLRRTPQVGNQIVGRRCRWIDGGGGHETTPTNCRLGLTAS